MDNRLDQPAIAPQRSKLEFFICVIHKEGHRHSRLKDEKVLLEGVKCAKNYTFPLMKTKIKKINRTINRKLKATSEWRLFNTTGLAAGLWLKRA